MATLRTSSTFASNIFLNKLFVKHKVSLTVSKLQLVCMLPDTGKSTLDLRTHLRCMIEKNIPFCKLNVVFRPSCRLGNLFRFKDSLEKKILSRIAYRYTCSNCKVTYYRKTFQHFFTRASKYMGTLNLMGKRIKKSKESAISDQFLQYDSPITFDDLDILASDSSKIKLLMKECLLIKRDKPVLNRTTKSFSLVIKTFLASINVYLFMRNIVSFEYLSKKDSFLKKLFKETWISRRKCRFNLRLIYAQLVFS